MRFLHRFQISISVLSLAITFGTCQLFAEDEAETPAPAKAPRASGRVQKIDKPLKVPDGVAQKGWDAYLKNDFPAAEAAFREALKAEPKNLYVLEGLRGTFVATGRYKDAQKINFEMIDAAADKPLCSIFTTRAMDTLNFVESRAALLEALTKTAEHANPAVHAMLKDNLAQLYYRMNKPDEARKMLASLNYVNHWQFVAGPFGSKDSSIRMAPPTYAGTLERRFSPERFLKSLEFEDENGQKVQVRNDVKTSDRDLNFEMLFPGSNGVFYAFTNIESENDQDVVLGVSTAGAYRVYLRGLPVAIEPEENERRSGGDLLRTRLVKGDNPLMLKLVAAGPVTVRIFGNDYAPAKGIKVSNASDALLASHTISSVRGYVMSQKTIGMLTNDFIQRFGSPEFKDATSTTTALRTEIKRIIESGQLNAADAIWLELGLQRESDATARLAIAREISGSFPDSAGMLDVAASVLTSAGGALGTSEAREAEESRALREHAVSKVADSHQHLLALYHFLVSHDLVDQAFERIQACVEAHPDSPLAQAELGAIYQRKQFMVEAEKCLEKAASLDEAYLPRLIFFMETSGNRARAAELRKRQLQLNMLSNDILFDQALHRGEISDAERILQEEEKAYPERKDDFVNWRVRLLREKGLHNEAYALQKKVYESLPNNQPSKRGTLFSLYELAIRTHKDDEAKAMLEAFIKEHPGDIDVQERLSELSGSVLPRWWEPYDVRVREIDTSQFNNEKYPSANHAWIVDFMVTRVMPDLSTESYVHIAQKVLNLQGINELSELLIRAQQQDIVYIRTLNPDGSVYQPQNVHDFNLARSASLYKVAPGSILEHAYVMKTAADEDEPMFNMGFNFNAIDAPRAVSRWVVIVPDEVKGKLDIRKVCGDMVDEKILPGPKGCTVYQWSNKQIDGIKREPLMPLENDQEVIPLVLVESAERPSRANAWMMRREMNDIPAEAAAEAKRIAAGGLFKAADAAQTFDTIVQWVRTNIQSGNDSQTLADVWYSRVGRSDQMLTLAYEMCKTAGLNVRIAQVNGSYLPGKTWHSKNAKYAWDPIELTNFGSGGRMIVLEPPVGTDKWAQFVGRTPSQYSPYELNFGQAGALAMTFGDDGLRIKRVRGEMLGLTPTAQRATVELQKNGTAVVNANLQLFGQLAGSWREALTDPRQNAQIKEYVVRYTWPKSQINNVTIIGQNQADIPLQFNYACTVKEHAAAAGETLFLPPFVTRPRLLDLRGPSERVNDMLIKDEIADLDQTITYIAPEGYAWTETPNDVFITTEFGFYLADYNVQGRTLTCTRSYLMPAQRITPDKYPKLLKFIQKVSENHAERIGYAPLKAESFGSFKRDVFSPGYSTNGEDSKQATAKK